MRPPRRRRTRRAGDRQARGGPPRSRSRHRQRHDRRGTADLTGEGIQHGDDEALLAAPELDLPLTLEERCDRLAELALEQVVGVDHTQPESFGDLLGGSRLARRHEADEDEPVVGGYRRHPMRSL